MQYTVKSIGNFVKALLRTALTVPFVFFIACTQSPSSHGQTYPPASQYPSRPPVYQPTYPQAYPQDNDSEYVPPRNYVPPQGYPYQQQQQYQQQQYQQQQYQQQQYQQQQQQQQQYQQQQYQQQQYQQQQPAYPQDNDSQYYPPNRYPAYDTQEDNSDYYYQPNKRLPQPKKSGSDYNYPIYFD